MKRKILYVAFTVLMTMILLTVASKILKRKYSDIEYRKFYKNAEEYEVLFYGPSVVHYSISPMQIWNDYGITCYNMGNDSERLTMTYYDIVNSLDYCKPKVIVVDLNAMTWAGSKRDNTFKDHNFIDAVPLSINKIKEVRAIFDKDEYAEYLVPFTLYHSRWNELTKEDFIFNPDSVMYGLELHQGIVSLPTPSEEQYEESRFGNINEEAKVMDEIIKLCDDEDVELVFTYLPSGVRGGDQKLREYCADYLTSKNAVYLDLLHLDKIEYSRDFCDEVHVNVFGSEKINDYLGKYLTENYDLSDYRNDDKKSLRWNEDYKEYADTVQSLKDEIQEAYEELAP